MTTIRSASYVATTTAEVESGALIFPMFDQKQNYDTELIWNVYLF
jgi:hypothetical protein